MLCMKTTQLKDGTGLFQNIPNSHILVLGGREVGQKEN